MQIRSGPYEAYWYFAAERQRIFFKRLRGEAGPFTDDPILRRYKFCNAYRASDRVSQFLIREVIYGGPQEPGEVLFRILFFRLLNRIETWQALETRIGLITAADFLPGAYDEALLALRKEGPIYGNAFILCANKAFGFDEKHRNHLALLAWIFQGSEHWRRLLEAPSLAELFSRLRELPLIGDFMAYQLAIDLNYSEVFNFSENDFTAAGPGARRGIAKCFADTDGKDAAYVIRWMVDNQEKEFARLGLDFQDLWGRPLMAIDCQGLFCETDKYCRVRFPELASNRVRIKASFVPAGGPPIRYFYPPKWGLTAMA